MIENKAGAEEGIRTPTLLRAPAPQFGATRGTSTKEIGQKQLREFFHRSSCFRALELAPRAWDRGPLEVKSELPGRGLVLRPSASRFYRPLPWARGNFKYFWLALGGLGS